MALYRPSPSIRYHLPDSRIFGQVPQQHTAIIVGANAFARMAGTTPPTTEQIAAATPVPRRVAAPIQLGRRTPTVGNFGPTTCSRETLSF
jgi:hypothetical protein